MRSKVLAALLSGIVTGCDAPLFHSEKPTRPRSRLHIESVDTDELGRVYVLTDRPTGSRWLIFGGRNTVVPFPKYEVTP